METEKEASQQSMSKKPNRDCALQTGPITWTLGGKGVVLLLRLWLWISKIKHQKKKEKERKEKKMQSNQNPTKQQQKDTIHYKHDNRRS